ncbi:single-strand binding protein/Primosomal replication protein n [Leucobacter sp. 7(1)]|uniref:Single-stranded DNA-binding protein n=1 Tax=Brevibacterium aurantiacum TaxID=273384 RepID=A0A368M078_BREAU|nr:MULTISPECIES: single-stranded DNA-binding protein [Micrococcales]AZT98119.1 single-stranded DNA-binding protein [Brevibacterium aurantiacum]RCS92241.1 single-stranded DNA-binding protein [Brevibacterium aurantiacum]SJN09818.1 single-strand binding protein/Primosomal replication protein n [Leucobacter sp. 7(1)]
MAIQTQESLSGFIASNPHLSTTENGDARLFVKIGQEHYRREDDGSFTQTETTFHDLVAFRKTAERAYQRFAHRDRFVAEGYTHYYERTDDNGQTVKAEEFVAKKIGHDLARTRYTVDRPRRTPATDSLDAGLEDAALSPDAQLRAPTGTPAVGR